MITKIVSEDYHNWLKNLKNQFRQTQLKAATAVNTNLLSFYWKLGEDIVEKQKSTSWGDGFIKQLSQDLSSEFDDVGGFSHRNLKCVRQWYLYWNQDNIIGQQAVAQLERTAFSISPTLLSQITSIPWGHNLVIMSKCKNHNEAIFYIQKTIEFGWSRTILTHQIEGGLFLREGKAVTNFNNTLADPQSELAQQLLKDPYNFDFLTLTANYTERELETALIDHISKFLLELGAGFAYMGRQIELTVGERDFKLDLLFYHTKLHSYVVVELKTVELEPEHLGKLNFYLKAVDMQMKSEFDNPSIGILICKTKDRLVTEYALSDISKPMGISEYQLGQTLPDHFKSSLPSLEEIQAELGEL
jgi:predicted nuclease of restriction endonuclease-like (RecB) superfamily